MLGDHVAVNRAAWDLDAPNWVESGRRAWATGEPTWGIWGVPETELKLLSDATGLDVVELGCGTGYISAWLARRGGRCIGLDNSAKQLDTARMFQREFDLSFPLVHADAERAPFADGSFDFAISEYGAAIWCDPYRWIPEASRLLRGSGFEIDDLIELRAPEGASAPYQWISSEWARRWPSEEVWKARKV